MEPAGGRPSRIEFGRQWLCDKRQKFMSPGTDTSIQKKKNGLCPMAQWRGASAKPPFQGKFLPKSTSNSTLQARPRAPGQNIPAQCSIRQLPATRPHRHPCPERGTGEKPRNCTGTGRNFVNTSSPSRRELATNTSTRSLFSPLRRCCRYSFARTAPDSPLTQQRSPPPLSTDVPFRAPLPALGSSRRPRHP